MSTKRSAKDKGAKKVKEPTDKEASESLYARRVAEGRAIPTPQSAPKAAAVDVAAEKRRMMAASSQQQGLKAAYDAMVEAADARRAAAKEVHEAAKKRGVVNPPAPAEPGHVFVVSNPTDDYVEFPFRGETIILAPGDNEFGDDFLPGVKGEDIAQQAVGFFGFINGYKAHLKSDDKRSIRPGDIIEVKDDEVAGALDFPAVHYEEIKGVSNPPAAERAQPVRYPANTEHDPKGVKTKASKQAMIRKIETGENPATDTKVDTATKSGRASAHGVRQGKS